MAGLFEGSDKDVRVGDSLLDALLGGPNPVRELDGSRNMTDVNTFGACPATRRA